MSLTASQSNGSDKLSLPALLCTVSVLLMWASLLVIGRSIYGSSETLVLRESDPSGDFTSQAVLDPYTLTHILHGFLFVILIRFASKSLGYQIKPGWALVIVAGVECLWEALENSPWIIDRYRQTMALGYTGDSIVNSTADVGAMIIGFLLVRNMSGYGVLLIFICLEGFLVYWIRDSLLLNIIMLIYPFQCIKDRQMSF